MNDLVFHQQPFNSELHFGLQDLNHTAEKKKDDRLSLSSDMWEETKQNRKIPFLIVFSVLQYKAPIT